MVKGGRGWKGRGGGEEEEEMSSISLIIALRRTILLNFENGTLGMEFSSKSRATSLNMSNLQRDLIFQDFFLCSRTTSFDHNLAETGEGA